MATLADDGRTLIERGGTGIGYLSVDGDWCDKTDLMPVSDNSLDRLRILLDAPGWDEEGLFDPESGSGTPGAREYPTHHNANTYSALKLT